MLHREIFWYVRDMVRVSTLIAILSIFVLPTAAVAEDLRVKVTVEGAPNDALRKELRALAINSKKEFTSVAPLRRGAQRDANLMRDALLSKGYYAAKVRFVLGRVESDVTAQFTVDAGDKFRIVEHNINYEDEISSDRPQTFAAIDVELEDTPTGDYLQSLQNQLLTHLRNNGYPSATSLGRRVDAKFADKTGVAVYSIETGPKAIYGAIEITGTEKTRRNHLRALRTFKRGEVVSAEVLAEYKEALADTELFTEVSVTAGQPDGSSVAPVLVTVTERKRRTLGTGVSFGTDVGVGTSAFWENRNFRGGGETIRGDLKVSAPLQSASLTYTKPVPRLPGSWGLDTLIQNEDTDAFNAQTFKFGGGITQTLKRRDLEFSAKLQYTASKIVDSDNIEETFSSISFPLAAIYNSENDPLNPTSGHRLRVSLTPFLGTSSFTQSQIGGATRITFGENDRLILATRALFGGTFGLDGSDVPATERFYAGGGGSVRGYGYQTAGPLDEDGDPKGGASLAELNVEARFLVRESIQLAAFVDAGSVFENSTPSFDGDIPVGAGFGIRYFTPVGPIRVDLATPLNRREITEIVDGETSTVFEDAPLQVYIALGQAF